MHILKEAGVSDLKILAGKVGSKIFVHVTKRDWIGRLRIGLHNDNAVRVASRCKYNSVQELLMAVLAAKRTRNRQSPARKRALSMPNATTRHSGMCT